MAGAVVTDPRIGTELAGYAIESLLGRGGMGVVYLARDPWLERRVALKLVAPEFSADPRFRERFLRESKLAASLEHAHVVPIYEAGEDEDVLYLAMRYIDGSDLRALLEERYELEPDFALQLLSPVAIALDAAHAKGLVHRDVKPGNILLAREPGDDAHTVYLSDFGLTARADDVALADQEGPSGTLDYAAPEQIKGTVQTAKTDVYALGCVLFECLTGEIPFPGERHMQKMFAHLEADPPRPSSHNRELPEELDAVVARALAKKPEERYESCADLVEAAAHALGLPGERARRAKPATAPVRNPYKGLRAFDELDADDFFGREALVDELKERLVDERLLAVVGPSGSGKSSAVRAGLLPALGTDKAWRIAQMVPGAHPLQELEAALLRLAPDPAAIRIGRLREDRDGLARCAESIVGASDSQVLLVVDQFEELFTLVLDDARRDWFLELLCAAAMDADAPIRIVVTLRADFFDRPLRIRNLAELVEAGQVTVLPLSPNELEQAITAPAERVGLELEPGLVADIIADVIDQPAALPLLQHALSELYESRDDHLLNREAYRSIGGVSGALSRRAEELYTDLDATGQVAGRSLFTRLVALGEGTEDTRRRVLRSEVEAIEQGADAMPGVLDAFGQQRLLSFGRDLATKRPTVEIAHEALLREWPRLRAWIDDDRDGLRLLRHVSESATAWERLEREPSELYRGSRLEDALAWRADHPGDLNPLEREFLGASGQLRDSEKLADEERARHRLKQNRRLRVALGVVALALVGAIVGAVVALDQRGTAREQTDRAEVEAGRATEAAATADAERTRAEQEAARAEEEAARAEAARAEEADARSAAETAGFEAETGRLVAEAAARADDNRRLALLLAAETHSRAPSLETLGALQPALVGHGSFQGYLGSGGEYAELEFSIDGERLIALASGAIEIYDMTTRTLIDTFDIEEAIESSMLSGERAASLGRGGEEAVVATAAGDVVVYSSEDGSTVATIRPDGETVTQVALAPNDGRIAVGHEDGTVSIWDRDGEGPPVRFKANANRVTEIAFSPDGTLLATASADVPFDGEAFVQPEPARMWDAATGAQVGADLPLTPEDSIVVETLTSLGFSADGETLITSDPDTLRRWSVPSGELLSSAKTVIPDIGDEFPAPVEGFATLPDGRIALDLTGRFVVVDEARLEPASAFVNAQLSIFGARAIAASADGSLVALGRTDGIFLWSPSGQQLLAQALPAGKAGVDSVFPFDENRLMTKPAGDLTNPSRPVVWDMRDPSPQPVPFAGRFHYPSFVSADGVFGITYFEPDQAFHVEVWDKQTITDTGVRLAFPAPVIGVDLERGWLIGRSSEGLFVFDIDTGEIIEQREGFVTFDFEARFNPDGTRLITRDGEGNATIWDTETWEHVHDFTQSDGTGVTDAAFAPSGELLTADRSGTVVVRDPETLEPIGSPMIGNRGGVGRLDFNTDGTRLLVGGGESVLWDFATRTRIGDAFPMLENWPGPDSSLRAVSVEDDNILTWNLNTDEWYDIACDAAGRNMTRAEWEEIGPRDVEYQATCPQFPLEPGTGS